MLTLRRAQQRYDDRRGKQAIWLTFYAQAAADPFANGFGRLQLLDEIRLPPGAAVRPQARHDTETITYVLAGALAYDDSLGRSGVLQAGEFRCMAATRGARTSEANASHTDWTHLFQIGLHSSDGSAWAPEQKRFSAAERRDVLRLIAAAAPRGGALRLREDASVYSALLQPGQHLVHDLGLERRAWLHVVTGEIALDGLVLTPGDGVGVAAERSVSFTARAAAEILLLDVA
jgi:redox-sensitive bicupin YhaK (pirin superfamily)